MDEDSSRTSMHLHLTRPASNIKSNINTDFNDFFWMKSFRRRQNASGARASRSQKRKERPSITHVQPPLMFHWESVKSLVSSRLCKMNHLQTTLSSTPLESLVRHPQSWAIPALKPPEMSRHDVAPAPVSESFPSRSLSRK